MYWKVNYIIDDGYEWHKRVCIIKADNEEQALQILYSEIGKKLTGEMHFIDEYTKIVKCDNNTILYDGYGYFSIK